MQYSLEIWTSLFRALPFHLTVIILKPKADRRCQTMAQRRAEKPKKVKLSSKQQEFYSRIGSSRGK